MSDTAHARAPPTFHLSPAIERTFTTGSCVGAKARSTSKHGQTRYDIADDHTILIYFLMLFNKSGCPLSQTILGTLSDPAIESESASSRQLHAWWQMWLPRSVFPLCITARTHLSSQDPLTLQRKVGRSLHGDNIYYPLHYVHACMLRQVLSPGGAAFVAEGDLGGVVVHAHELVDV